MKRSMFHRLPRRALLVGAVAALTALVAATAALAQLSLKPATDETLITRSGQTIAVDSKTGRIRPPTREEAVALAQQMLGQYSRSVAPVIHSAPNGMMWANLPEEYQEVMVLRFLPDGSSSVECVHGFEVAEDLVLRGDMPKADCHGGPVVETVAKIPAAAIEKPAAPAASTAAAAPPRLKSIRKSAKSVATVRR